MTFIELFNALAVFGNAKLKNKNLAECLDQDLSLTDIDSLSRIMVSVYLCDIYEIPEVIGKHMPLTSVAMVQDFIISHSNKKVISFEEELARLA